MTSEHNTTSESYRELTTLLRNIISDRTTFTEPFNVYFLGRSPKIVNATEIKDMYYSGRRLHVFAMSVRIPEYPLAELTNFLRDFLKQYIENDHIGDGVSAGWLVSTPKIKDFARSLAWPTAILEPERVAELLCKWEKGEPIQNRLCGILSGISIDDSVTIKDGIKIFKPNSDSSSYTPVISYPQKLKNALQVNIQLKASPAFFNPKEECSTISYKGFNDNLLTVLCEALSLASNHCVLLNFAWIEYKDVDAFMNIPSLVYSYHSSDNPDLSAFMEFSYLLHVDRLRDYPVLNYPRVTKEQLDHVKNLLSKINTVQNSKKRLNLAVTRWVKSKQQKKTSDRFIDLRIALEALYLKRDKGDFAFKIANYGAWHLGRDYNERVEYRNTLRYAYNQASKAIHAGEVDDNEKNRDLLAAAQNLCRKGILKRLDETEEPKWDEMILGKNK